MYINGQTTELSKGVIICAVSFSHVSQHMDSSQEKFHVILCSYMYHLPFTIFQDLGKSQKS